MSSLEIGFVGGLFRTMWRVELSEFPRGATWIGNDVLVVGDADGEVRFLSADQGEEICRQGAHPGGVTGLTSRPEHGEVATSGEDGRLRLWDRQGCLRDELDPALGCVTAMEWSPDGRYLGAICARRLVLWDLRLGRRWRSSEHEGQLTGLCWTSSDEVLTVSSAGLVSWSVPSGRPSQEWARKSSPLTLAVSPDKRLLAWGNQDKSVVFWNRSERSGFVGDGYSSKPSSLSFDRSSTFLAANSGYDVTVWSFSGEGPEGTEPQILELHEERVLSVSFAGTEPLLLSSGKDGRIVLWWFERQDKAKPVGLAVADSAVEAVVWRGDGAMMVGLQASGNVWALGV